MKLLVSVFLLLVISVVTVYSAPVTTCPPDTVLGKTDPKCTCKTSPTIITCTGINKEWLKNFEPTQLYEIDTLIINDSPGLPFFQDKFHNKEGLTTGIKVKTVIFNIAKSATIQPHIMDSLLAVASEAIQIKSTNNAMLVIETPQFPETLRTLSLENVKITKSDGKMFEKLNSLETFQLKHVSFEKIAEKIIIKNAIRVDITDSEKLTKSLQYIPKSPCTGNEIVLNLQNNKELKSLDMSSMFGAMCKYYVDLSKSGLDENFLINNEKFLLANVKTIGQIFLILRDTPVFNCDECVRRWYKIMPDYVHSVSCKSKDPNHPKYIDQFVDKELPKCTL